MDNLTEIDINELIARVDYLIEITTRISEWFEVLVIGLIATIIIMVLYKFMMKFI